MIKPVIVLAAIMCSNFFPAEAQRPFYASRGSAGVLQVLPQYETAENRFGGSPTVAPPKPTDSNTLEDPDLINRVGVWPREKQPFWYLNSAYISNQRKNSLPCNGPNCPSVGQSRPVSSFLRSSNQ